MVRPDGELSTTLRVRTCRHRNATYRVEFSVRWWIHVLSDLGTRVFCPAGNNDGNKTHITANRLTCQQVCGQPYYDRRGNKNILGGS